MFKKQPFMLLEVWKDFNNTRQDKTKQNSSYINFQINFV